MALIMINEVEENCINGNVTIERAMVDNNIVITGKLVTHKYIEEIKVIDTHRYKITGINVLQESFGSNDFSILYEFTAEDIEIIYDSLDEDVVDTIEESLGLYVNSDCDLWELDFQEGGEDDGDK